MGAAVGPRRGGDGEHVDSEGSVRLVFLKT